MRFIDNHSSRLLDELVSLLDAASEVYIAVAFVRRSGVALLTKPLRLVLEKGGHVSLLFGLDFAISEAAAVRSLVELGVETRCFSSPEAFHPKGYIVRRGHLITAVIGSSNLSGSGLTAGREWNVLIDDAEPVLNEFIRLWNSNHAQPVTDAIYERLERSRPPLEASAVVQKEDRVEEIEVTHIEIGKGKSAIVSLADESSFQFSFTINQSFMRYGQITVPKRQVDYDKLEAEGFGAGRLRIMLDGELPLHGFMRSAQAGFGLYYQIAVQQDGLHPLFRLPIGTRVNVVLDRTGDGNVARILTR